MTADLLPLLGALHLGALHPVEGLLVLLLAFGPFVLLGVVVAVRRRQDAREDAPEDAQEDAGAQRER